MTDFVFIQFSQEKGLKHVGIFLFFPKNINLLLSL
jgi:hypothetical protein